MKKNANWSSFSLESRSASNLFKNSVITASKKKTMVSTASVSFHSSYFKIFMLDKLQTNDQSSVDGRAISEQRLLCLISRLLSLYTSTVSRLTVSLKKI